jgi:RNA polymerase sigma-70 factor (ECF subfamily)
VPTKTSIAALVRQRKMPAVSVDPRVAAVLEGDRQAAESLLGEFLPRIRNVTRTLLGRDRDVNDMAQKVLVELLQTLPDLGEQRRKRWCDRATVRVVLAHLRQEHGDTDEVDDVDDVAPEEDDTRVSLPDGYLVRRDMVTLLDELPLDLRAALVMVELLGFSPAEAERVENLPGEIVLDRARQAKDLLRQVAEQRLGGE